MLKRAAWFLLFIAYLQTPVLFGQISSREEAKRSMVHLLVDDSNCNGVLLNNTQLDGRALVLTAGHCVTDNNRFISATFGRDILLDQTTIQSASWTTTNISVLELSRDLDYMLLEINDDIPDYVLPYYAGWNSGAGLPLYTYSIHSPDIAKRFNEDLDRPTFATFDVITTFGGTPVKDATFNIGDWETGFTQAGSSGAPLFNQWSQMVGILSGGSSTAENPVNDFYSRWDLIYEDGVRQYVNPAGRTSNVLRGLDFYRERSSLFKQVNYDGASEVVGNTGESMLSERFESSGFRVLAGVFITLEEVVPTDLMQIRVVQGSTIVYEQELFTGALQEFEENYVSFDNAIEVNNGFTIELSHNNSLTIPLIQQTGSHVVVGSSNRSDTSLGIGVLLRGLPDALEDSSELSVLYPNPSTSNFFVNRGDLVDISSVEAYTINGVKLRPRVTLDFDNRLIIDMSDYQKGVYFISYQVMDEVIRSTVILN